MPFWESQRQRPWRGGFGAAGKIGCFRRRPCMLVFSSAACNRPGLTHGRALFSNLVMTYFPHHDSGAIVGIGVTGWRLRWSSNSGSRISHYPCSGMACWFVVGSLNQIISFCLFNHPTNLCVLWILPNHNGSSCRTTKVTSAAITIRPFPALSNGQVTDSTVSRVDSRDCIIRNRKQVVCHGKVARNVYSRWRGESSKLVQI